MKEFRQKHESTTSSDEDEEDRERKFRKTKELNDRLNITNANNDPEPYDKDMISPPICENCGITTHWSESVSYTHLTLPTILLV